MKINSRVMVMREAVTKIVKLLSTKSIRVTQQGSRAYVDYHPKTLVAQRVNIPYIPDDASDELLDAVQGFLDHEVAHILYSDPEQILKAKKAGVHAIFNIIEDSFIERKMAANFQGSSGNLAKVGKYVLERYTSKELEKNPENAAAILMMPMIRAWAGQTVFKDFMADKWHLVEKVTAKLGPDAEKLVASVKSSADTFKVASEFKARLSKKDPAPEMPPAAPPMPMPPSDSKPEASDVPADDDADESETIEKPDAADKPEPKDEKDTPETEEKDEDKPADREPEETEPTDKPADESADLSGDADKEGKPDGDDAGDGELDEPADTDPTDETPEAPETGDEPEAPADEPESSGEPESGDEPAPADEPEAGDKPEEGGDTDEGDTDEGEEENTDEGASASEDKPSEGTEEGDEEERESDAGDGETPPVDPESETEPGDTGSDATGDAASTPSDESEDIDDGSPSMFDELDDKGAFKDYDETISDEVTKEMDDTVRDSEYLIYTKDFDRIEPLEIQNPEFVKAGLKDMQTAVDGMVGVMQKDMERIMAARSQVVWTGGHKSGRLHGAGLTRLMFGRDDVFRRKTENRSKDVAVEIVVDASGSMRHKNRIQIASYSAYALSSVLQRMGIVNEVVAFTTKVMPYHARMEMQREVERIGRRAYSRQEALWMPIIKSFNESIDLTVKERLVALFQEVALRENVDGECIQIAAHRLMRRREARKIMLVLSDGEPWCYDGEIEEQDRHLKTVTRDIEKRGQIELVGIGIQTAAVKRYYKNNIVLNDVDALPGECMRQLKDLLFK